MKVFLNYEDNENSDLHKSLKITLPKSWKTGPSSNLLEQFVESYNAKFQDTNPLKVEEMHLTIRQQVPGSTDSTKTELVPICSDAVVLEEIPDRGDVYICHGPSQTKADLQAAAQAAEEERQNKLKNTVACTHFGCQNRFPKGGPYPECRYHKLPPVFHETAKYWACCPNKKAYDWDDFQRIPGCETGTCTEIKEDGKLFLGGTDLREQASEGAQLKSIDDFNKAQSAGGAEAAPVLDRLRNVMVEMGIDKELYDQVIDGMKMEYKSSSSNEAELLAAVSQDLGGKLKAMMKSIAAEQLRIK
ncbi:CHORD-domain containing protein [Nitzschia inconspicua]|uniref:CHORD-domain containing protein n=1 Tax=Nitzschia inconspicua TaxID=303405 RepID=A0A9K3LUR6_9STRA|nr:CHORD-domain containing protein [Nitzschia inconspicua]